MQKYIWILCCVIGLSAQAQTYKAKIDQYRQKYMADFISDQHSPLKETDLVFLDFFNADSTYEVTAKVTLLSNQKIFKMPTYDGTSKEFIRYAQLDFMLRGQPIKLTCYKSIVLAINPAYKNLLFLPFTDLTNGKSTYGGGRYIDLDLTNIHDEKIVIDFNKAYNPYCAYSDGYRCPIPPQENNIELEILAGEKLFKGEKKHK